MNDSSLLSQEGKNKFSISLQKDLEESQPIQWRNQQINFDLESSNCFQQMEQNDYKYQQHDKQSELEQKPTETSDFNLQKENIEQTIQFGEMEGDTIFGQNSLLNYTGPNSSGSTQSYGQTSMYKNFQMADLKIYRVHIESINNLYQKVKQYSEKSLQNSTMYFSFFKVKEEQHQHYLQNKQIQQFQFLEKKLSSNDAYRQAFMNSKLAIDVIIEKKMRRLRSSKQILITIKRCRQILEKAIKSIINARKTQQTQIQTLQQKINNLYKQISLMIIDRIGRQSLIQDLDNSVMSPIQNAQLLQRDRYLESKYLVQCQKKYLQHINQVTGVVIKYVNAVLNEQQVVICTTLKDCLQQYCIIKQSEEQKSQQQLSVDSKLKFLLEQDLLTHVLEDNKALLLKLLTGNLQNSSYKKPSLNITDLISMLNKDLQQIIYLPVLDIPEKLVKAKFTDIVWTPSKEVINTPVGANFKPFEAKNSKANKYKINLILSIDGFLHFEQGSSILTYHLKDLKLQKKMNVFNVIDKGKGMLGYFMRKTDVGKIDLKTDQDAEEFINSMNDIMIKFS